MTGGVRKIIKAIVLNNSGTKINNNLKNSNEVRKQIQFPDSKTRALSAQVKVFSYEAGISVLFSSEFSNGNSGEDASVLSQLRVGSPFLRCLQSGLM